MSEAETVIAADLCSVEGCVEPRERREYCREHYEEYLANRRAAEAEKAEPAKRKNTRATFRLPDREIERAYLGGLIDGEGSITRFDPKYGNWAIKIYMTDKEIVDWLHANIGGSVSEYKAKNRTKVSHLWHLSRQADVREFLLAVRPYLKIHRKQMKAREALTEIDDKAAAKEAKRSARNGARQSQR